MIAILEPHENHEWRSGLAVNGLYHRDKASVQRAPLCFAKCADTVGRPGDPLYKHCLLSECDDTFANTPVMVSHREENEEREALNSADIKRIPAPSLL